MVFSIDPGGSTPREGCCGVIEPGLSAALDGCWSRPYRRPGAHANRAIPQETNHLVCAPLVAAGPSDRGAGGRGPGGNGAGGRPWWRRAFSPMPPAQPLRLPILRALRTPTKTAHARPLLPHRYLRYPFVSFATPWHALPGSDQHQGVANARTGWRWTPWGSSKPHKHGAQPRHCPPSATPPPSPLPLRFLRYPAACATG